MLGVQCTCNHCTGGPIIVIETDIEVNTDMDILILTLILMLDYFFGRFSSVFDQV